MTRKRGHAYNLENKYDIVGLGQEKELRDGSWEDTAHKVAFKLLIEGRSLLHQLVSAARPTTISNGSLNEHFHSPTHLNAASLPFLCIHSISSYSTPVQPA